MASGIFKDTPLYRLLRGFSTPGYRWMFIPVLFGVSFMIRWAVGMGPYSGCGTPPMFGDFEAQRHWMEITINLPLKKWYRYNLEYWGLDYPPLQAYLSMILGYMARWMNPEWVELDTSVGFESVMLKQFMRWTVNASEYLLLIPGIMYFCRFWWLRNGSEFVDWSCATFAIIMQPALILIDHGHFQYNNIMLGLSLSTICNFLDQNYALAAAVFTAAISFKQMALYYAPAVFFYLLGQCWYPHPNFARFLRVAIAAMLTALAIYGPFFLADGLDGLRQVIVRMFPFDRGLWEDKVANFWCTFNNIYKIRAIYSLDQLKLLSLQATVTALVPTCFLTFIKPRRSVIPYALAGSAFAFYLFSFQVHEKSILLPLFPLTLNLAGAEQETKWWIGFANNIGVFSMWPLLKKDGLWLQYLAIQCLWNWAGSFYKLPPSSSIFVRALHWPTLLFILGYHIAELVAAPPERYPDIYPVLNSAFCFGCFAICWLWTLIKLRSGGSLDVRLHSRS